MDWVGAFLQMVGRWRIGGRHIDAFVWSILGRLIFIVWYSAAAQYPVVALAVLSILLDARAYTKWRHYQRYRK
jgi:hypothetical protein